MAKRKPVLKWRKVTGGMVCWPFVLYYWDSLLRAPYWSAHLTMGNFRPAVQLVNYSSLTLAKAACERLARKIIAATKKGRKHGK